MKKTSKGKNQRRNKRTKQYKNHRHCRGNYVLIHNGLLYVMQQKLVLERSSGNICVHWLIQKSSFRVSLRRRAGCTTVWKVTRKRSCIFLFICYTSFVQHKTFVSCLGCHYSLMLISGVLAMFTPQENNFLQ